jgi:hypothetical protein
LRRSWSWYLITALVQTGQDSQAHEALRRYLALPGAPATAAALKQETAKYVNERDDPRYVEKWDQLVESRKTGLPEKRMPTPAQRRLPEPCNCLAGTPALSSRRFRQECACVERPNGSARTLAVER